LANRFYLGFPPDGKGGWIGGGLDDRIRGGKGNDTLFGNSGAGRLFGGLGDDILNGGNGGGFLNGGPGTDTCSFFTKVVGCEDVP
jgi:Ca2+-binding RTX toxin-like protein